MLHPTDAEQVADSQLRHAEMDLGTERGTGGAILALAYAVLALASATKYVGDRVEELAKR